MGCVVERVKPEEDKKIWRKKQAFHQESAAVCTVVCGLGAGRERFEYLPGQGRHAVPEERVTTFALIMYQISQRVSWETHPITKLTPRSSVPHLGPGQMTGKEDHLLLPVTDVNFVTEW